MDEILLEKLKQYFLKEPNVSLAFLHGSKAKGKATDESDIDIAVYLKDATEEDRVWREITNICQAEVDIVLMNDAPPTLISSAFKTGIPLAIKDRNLFWKLYLEKTMEAEDFSEFAQDFWKISQRSKSLTPEDKARLTERLTFLENEMNELDKFKNIHFQEYQENRPIRRELERWTENILNALIDSAKIILASEHKNMPRTYEEVLRECAILAGLPIEKAHQLSNLARLRNLLAHEYLDILFDRIHTFIEKFPDIYKELRIFFRKYI